MSDSTTNVLMQTMPIPTHCVGHVIGREGHTIRAIEERSHCKLSMREGTTTNFNQEWMYCTIQGKTGHHVNTAKQLILLNCLNAVDRRADEL